MKKGGKAAMAAAWIFAGTALYALGLAVISWGISALHAMLMDIWGVNAENASLAPWWIRGVIYGSGAAASAAQLCWIALMSALLYRMRGKKAFAAEGRCSGGKAATFGAWGALTAVACAAILLAADGVRMGRPLNMPQYGMSFWNAVVSALCAAAGEELFFRGCLYRGTPGRLAPTLICAILYGLLHGFSRGISAAGFLNACLLSALLCRIYARTGSLLPGIAFRFGFLAMIDGILGFEGSTSALYELYYASHNWLSGGAKSPMSGWAMTLCLLFCLAGWERKRLQSLFARR